MAKENDSTINSSSENLDAVYVPLIKDANKIFSTLSTVWNYSHVAIFSSLYLIGFVSFGLYFMNPANYNFRSLGIVFLIIATIFFLQPSGTRRRRDEMTHWKIMLASLIKPDNTLNTPQDGQSILENLMQVILASEKWISRIKRRIFTMILLQTVAVVAFFAVLYQTSSVQVQLVENGLIVFAVALVLIVYFSVDLKFRGWQNKIAKFKSHVSIAVDRL